MDMLERLLSVQIIERIGWTLIHFVWQGAAIALLLAITLRALHRRSASVRYLVACAALGLVVVMPLVTMPFVEVTEPPAEVGSAIEPVPALEPLPVEVVEVGELPIQPIETTPVEFTLMEVHVPWTQRAVTALEPALPYLVFGWLLGVFGLSAWHLGGWAQLQRMRCRMVREVAKPLEAKLADLATQLGVTRAVGLLQSALVEVPTVVGWIKPVILLPASAISGLTADQLEAILAHELAHIRRYDYLVNILQTVVEILGFYHPGLWWISQKIRDEREHCCDDLAVHVTGDSVRYARALTSLEEMRHRGAELAIAAGGGNLLGRIARLLGRPTPRQGRFTWLPGLIALILATLIVIPTALVLAAPKPMLPEAAVAELSVQEEIEANTPAVETAPEPVETPAIPAAAEAPEIAKKEDKPVVDLTLIMAKVRTETVLDRETLGTITDVLAQDRPEVRDEIRALGSGSNLTLGELVQKCVMGKLLTTGTVAKFTSTLGSAGLLEMAAKPSMRTLDNQSATITIGQEVPIPLGTDPNAGVTYANVGTSIEVIPHLSEKRDLAIVQMDVTLNELNEDQRPNGRPGINTKQIATEVCVSNDRYFSLLMDTNEANRTTDAEPLLLMFRTRWDELSIEQEDGSVRTARPTPDRERFVKLDLRVVEADREDMMNVGLEWGWPKLRPSHFSGSDARWAAGIGCADERMDSARILAALNDLCTQDKAKIIAVPYVTARNGKASDMSVMEEEYYLLSPSQGTFTTEEMVTITSGINIKATPFIGDNNDVTLNVDTEMRDATPSEDPNDLPIVTRRTSRNVCKIHDGGTMALWCLSPRTDSGDDEPHKEVFILITPHILSDVEAAKLPHKKKPAPLPAVPTKSKEAPKHLIPVPTVEQVPSTVEGDTSVLMDFVFAEMEMNAVLDRETARKVRALLADAAVGRDFTVPDVDALQESPAKALYGKTLTMDLSGDAVKALTDLLISTGHARVLSAPHLPLANGRPGIVRIGYPMQSPGGEDAEITLEVTPRIPQDPATIDTTMKYSIGPFSGQAVRNDGKKDPMVFEFLVPWKMHKNEYALIALPIPTRANGTVPKTLLILARPTIVPQDSGQMTPSETSMETTGHRETPSRLLATSSASGNVTATFHETTLLHAIGEISRQTGVKIATDKTVKPLNVTAVLENAALAEALETVLDNTGYAYRMESDNTCLIYRPISAKFMGEDLRQALQKVGYLARVPIVVDANVMGVVYTSLEKVSLETALKTLLTGTPYYFKDSGDYYLVMVREMLKLSSNTESEAIQIETRFLVLSDELVEALQRGTLIEDTNSPEEIAALATLEKRMTPNEWIGVDETVVSTLLNVAQGGRETHSLAAPRLTVPVDESASLALTDTIFYTSGYDEPNDGSGVPVAREATVSPGLKTEITPSLAPEDQIILNGTTTFTNLKGFEDRTYRNEHVYQIPVLDTDEIVIENVHLADGQAVLLLTPSGIQSGPTKESSDSEEASPLLILIEAKKGFIEGSDTSQMPPMLQHQPLAPTKPLPPGGFGGSDPGPLPPVPEAAEQD